MLSELREQNKPQDEVESAVLILRNHWHHLEFSAKSKIAERHITISLQTMHGMEEPTSDDYELAVAPIVEALMPVNASEQGGSVFDGQHPTFHSVVGEIIQKIAADFDLDDIEPDAEKAKPFLLALKA